MQLTKSQRDVIAKMQQGLLLVQYTSGQTVKLFDGNQSEKVPEKTLDSLLEKGVVKRVKAKDSYDKFELIMEVKLRKK